MRGTAEQKKRMKRMGFVLIVLLLTICGGIVLTSWIQDRKEAGRPTGTAVSMGAKDRINASEARRGSRSAHDKEEHRKRGKIDENHRISITTFKSDEFDAAWAEAIRAGGTEVDRVYNLSLVVGRMSQIGDPGQILEKIIGQFGPGKSRCHLIGSLFMGSDRIDALKVAYGKLEFSDEKTAACSGLSHGLCMVDSLDLIDRTKYAFLGSRFDDVLEKALELYVARFQSKPADELSSAVRKAVDLQTTVESKRNLLSKLVGIAPFDCWEQLVGNNLELAGPEREALLAQMFGRDAGRAMDRIAAAEGGEKYFSSAFQQWLANDASKPIEWLEAHKQSLSLAQKENAIQGIAEYSARQGDWGVARQWVEQITDPELRRVVEGRVWSRERDIIRREVTKNPVSAIESMMAGGSSHQDYWIEEAVATWVAKEPTKVQEWYQQNWKSLPATKSQYVAAAFAGQAVKQGDLATARQWATYIQNPKTKQRIETGIANAEGSPPQ